MAISSMSDIIIAITLILNGMALSSSKTKSNKANENNIDDVSQKDSERGLLLKTNKAIDAVTENVQEKSKNEKQVRETSQPELNHDDVYSRVILFLNVVRRFSFLISLWNVVFLFMMVFVFNKKD